MLQNCCSSSDVIDFDVNVVMVTDVKNVKRYENGRFTKGCYVPTNEGTDVGYITIFKAEYYAKLKYFYAASSESIRTPLLHNLHHHENCTITKYWTTIGCGNIR